LQVGGLVVGGSATALTLRHKVPAVYEGHDWVTAGGLMSYGGNLRDAYRLAGVYAARVLKGERPAELAVQQGTKLELYINLKTAKALGINVPKHSYWARRRRDRIAMLFAAVHESAFGPKRTLPCASHMSAIGGKADMTFAGSSLLRSLLGVKRT